ncbi:MAG: NTP transferase domain-containing protein [Phycisphaerales bacterium]|nr:NTP transferase domain-containing protein [Phycisphaerales bacterium]
MRIGTIIQARMGSTRLPGKMLEDVNGAPLLTRVVERVRASTLSTEVIVATTSEPRDDRIARLCGELRLPVIRGSRDDVASRFLSAVDSHGLDAFVRVCGDSPLMDPCLIDKGVDLLVNGGFEIVTNNLRRTFPKGQTVEVLKSDTFRRGYEKFSDDGDREHVTRWFYAHADQFRVHNFTMTPDRSDLALSVDTEMDLRRVRDIFATMREPHWGFGLDWMLNNVVVVRGCL